MSEAPIHRSPISRIATICVISSVASIAALLFLLWSFSGPVDDDVCDVYCGPTNLLVAELSLFLAGLTWLIALAMLCITLAKRKWALASIASIGVIVPAVYFIAQYALTH
ncbi:MAG TPA: hypothetical protein PKN33_21460 [Phycisphaerae bacterium]|nr:hypothetical protein [Phycisphaerae bacterium]